MERVIFCLPWRALNADACNHSDSESDSYCGTRAMRACINQITIAPSGPLGHSTILRKGDIERRRRERDKVRGLSKVRVYER